MASIINSVKFENKMVANSSKLFQNIEENTSQIILWDQYYSDTKKKKPLISQEDYRLNMSNENICKILSNWI